MKFELVVELRLWEEVHNDGGPKTRTARVDFESDSYTAAIERSAAMVKELVDEYPKMGGHGEISFQSCKAELNEIKPVWKAESAMETVRESVEFLKIKMTLKSENLYDKPS